MNDQIPSNSHRNTITLGRYIKALRRLMLFAIAIPLATVAIGGAVLLTQHPSYQADARVYVAVRQADSVQDLTQGNSFTQSIVKSYADVAITSSVLNPVIKELNLQTSAQELSSRISVTAPLDTVILDISATAPSPQMAAQIANGVATSLQKVVTTLTPSATQTGADVRLTVVQRAVRPAQPIAPKPLQTTAVAAIVGVALSLAFVYMLELLTTRVRNEHDVDETVGLPVIGAVPADPLIDAHRIADNDVGFSARAESYRAIRTNLQYLRIDERKQHRSFLVTSAGPGEGKSTTAVNLASTLAASGQSVLIVDADLRRPAVATYLGLDGSIGLTDVLIGEVLPEKAIQETSVVNLHALPAGTSVPDPADLLDTQTMRATMADLVAKYDFVVYDAPPNIVVADAMIVGTQVSAVILVCASGKTRRSSLRASYDRLARVGAPAVGVVLSMVHPRENQSYDYGYGYAYGYTGHPLEESTRSEPEAS